MRISLLRQREPFSDILERTLGQYFANTYGGDYQVKWSNGKSSGDKGQQKFLVNEYINAIFHPTLTQEAFDPIRREYSRSTSAWKRPAQLAYVRCATTSPTAAWLAHASLCVEPPIPELTNRLIIPGNQKIRILDHLNRTCTSVLKSGFRNDAMRADQRGRELAAAVGINVPETLSASVENGVHCEAYISATPLNRLASPNQAQQTRQQAFSGIQRLVESTQHQQPLSDYLDALVEQAVDRVNPYSSQNPQVVEGTQQLVRFLQNQALEHADNESVLLSESHGDFQPANILLNNNGVWLIDWENAARRQSGYDWLVFEIESRSTRGMTGRLLATAVNDNVEAPNWTGLDFTTRSKRIHHLAIFLLEELATKANEVSHPAIPNIATDFVSLVDQATEWQTQTAN